MKIFILLITIFTLIELRAQNQNNVWHFGYHPSSSTLKGSGLDFNSGVPVPITNSGMNNSNGNASYCNSAGQIMFYTNGFEIFDSTHNIMQGGSYLGGSQSVEQSALIIPVTGDSNIYNLFTNSGNILYHATIDMTLNNGLGGVTAILDTVSNICGEQLVGTIHGNGGEFWLISVNRNSFLMYAFKVGPSGISSPVISNFNLLNNCTNSIKISPDGNKIAAHAYFDNNTATQVLFDFDKHSGVISNYKLLNNSKTNSGFEFSSNSNLLYNIDLSQNIQSLVQFDITATNILSSKTSIAQLSNTLRSDMKLGPDGKIYILRSTDSLDVISVPNASGSNCNFSSNYIYLNGRNSGNEFPNTNLVADHNHQWVGINKNNDPNITLYPNPTSNIVYLRNLEENAVVKVWSITGQLLQIVTSNQNFIDMSNLKNGTYLVEVKPSSFYRIIKK